MKPEFNYIDDISATDADNQLCELVLDKLACGVYWHNEIRRWIYSSFKEDAGKHMLAFVAPPSTGKTTGATLLSLLLTGRQDAIGKWSASAAIHDFGSLPLMVFDNLEHRDLNKSMVNFLSSPGGSKERPANLVPEKKIGSLILITQIEPLPYELPELRRRAIEVPFEATYMRSDFVFEDACREILSHRDAILTGIQKLVA